MELRNGDILVTRSGRRLKVVRFVRHDDDLDTFRLLSLEHGTIGARRWTVDELRGCDIRKESA